MGMGETWESGLSEMSQAWPLDYIRGRLEAWAPPVPGQVLEGTLAGFTWRLVAG